MYVIVIQTSIRQEQIFDILFKDKQIKLSNDSKLMRSDEIIDNIKILFTLYL